MTGITVADSLLKELESIGVDTVFGIISIHNLPIYDSLQRHGGFRVVTGRHEGAVMNMADAYSRISGKLGVALTSTGTGAGNAAGAIIEAWNAGAPVLHITGQVASDYIDTGQGYIHECKDQLTMLEAVGKAAYRVSQPDQAPAVFRRAIIEAMSAPSGPVSIEIPIDFQARLIHNFELATLSVKHHPDPEFLLPAARKIAGAQRPVIWAGGGAMLSDAGPEVHDLMELLDAAVVTSHAAQGIVPETDLRCIGSFGSFTALRNFLAKSDLLISIGVRFRGNETSNWRIDIPQDHIGIDADPMAFNRNFRHSIGLAGDAKQVLPLLIPLILEQHPKPKPAYREEVAELRRALRTQVRETLGPYEGILDAIQELMPADAILVRDVTVPSTTWGSRLIVRHRPRTTLHASAGGIGQGLPMAIGAQIAAPTKRVILLCGDGGLLLNIGEMAVARQENTPIVMIVFDDGGYGVLRNIQNAHFGGKTIGVDLQSPDFAAVARGFGWNSARAGSAEEFRKTLAAALADRQPAMVVVDCNAIGPMKKIFGGPDQSADLYKPH